MAEYARKIVPGVVIAIVLGSSFVFGLYYYLPQVSTSSSVTLPTSTTSMTSQGNGNTSLCSGSNLQHFDFGDTLLVGASSSPGVLCIQYYYYSAQPQTFNTTSQIGILGKQFDAASNFSINGSPSVVTIGGSSNESEGVLVAYTIAPRAGSNGTYWLNLGWVNTSQGRYLDCGTEFKLISGSGVPDFTPGITGMCITTVSETNVTSIGGSSIVTTTAISPTPYPEGILIAKIVGATNSTS